MRLFLFGGVSAAAVIVIGCALAAAAGDAPATAGSTLSPPPSARAGRVSLVSGKVEFRGPGDSQWSPAAINDPVAGGVAARTDAGSRGEIRIGADTIDLAEATEITVAELGERIAEIAVRQGRLDLDIRRLVPGESFQIDIPRGGVWLLQPGRYDIDAGGGDRPVRIAAFTGGARFAGTGGDFPIRAGDRAVFAATGPIAVTTDAASGDEFAEWCGARAVDDKALAAPYFMSREMTGYAALDAAGNWRWSRQFGAVWTPSAVSSEWAPYRDGHWRWLATWGWIWVDSQPWGFATSHYGRWRFADDQWSWMPGAITAAPLWVPAVVAFLGTPGVGLSYAGPGAAVAWFPLAPGEIYWPSYTGDRDYIRAINRGNVADLPAIAAGESADPPAEAGDARFANRIYASVVPRPVFVTGGPVASALVTIPAERLRDAPAILGSPRIGPPPPPAAVRVAGGPPRDHQPPEPATAKNAGWAGIVHAAAIRSRHFQEAARLRLTHLRLVAIGEIARLRHTLVLRVARADHAPPLSEGHKRVIRR